MEVCTTQNELWVKLISNFEFMKTSLSKMEFHDELTSNLLKIANAVYDAPHRSKKRLIMARNDFMADEAKNEFFQVEFNLIASSLFSICQGAREVHNITNSLTEGKVDAGLKLDTIRKYTEALRAGFKAYGNPEAVVVIVIDPLESNLFDGFAMHDELALEG